MGAEELITPESVNGSTPTEEPTPAPSPGENNEPSEPGSEPAPKTPDEEDGDDDNPIPRKVFNDRIAKKEAAWQEKLDKQKEEFDNRIAEIEGKITPKDQPSDNKDEWPEEDEEKPLTQKDLKEWEKKKESERREKETREWYDNRHKELEKEYDGRDGRPKYDKKEVLEHVRKNPQDAFPDPLDVYRKIHFEKLADWKALQKIKANKSGHVENNAAPKKPAEVDTSKMSQREYDDYVRSKYPD